MFANMELAWETLDEKIKDKIKDKKALHSSLGAEFFVNDYRHRLQGEEDDRGQNGSTDSKNGLKHGNTKDSQ